MSQIRAYFPDWKVFIFGQDVTADVTRCVVNFTGSKSRAPSTAEIELVNGGSDGAPGDALDGSTPQFATDRYVITDRDIAVLYGAEEELPQIQFPDVKDVLAELETFGSADIDFGVALPSFEVALSILRADLNINDPGDVEAIAVLRQDEQGFRIRAAQRAERLNRAREITSARTTGVVASDVAQRQDTLDRLIRERIQARITDPVKRRVLERKFNIRTQLKDAAGNDLQPNLLDPFDSTTIAGLPQLSGQALRYPFQTGDSIFHTNDMVRIFWRDPANPEAWYHMFAGFVSDSTDVVDENDQRIVRLRFEDATRVLRYARLTTNPGILDIDATAQATDAITRTFFNDGFTGLTLPEFLFTVLFGASGGETEGQTGTADIQAVQTYSNLRVGVNSSSQSTLLADAVGAYNRERSFVAIFGPEENDGAAPVRFPFIQLNGLGEYQALVDHRVTFADLDNMSLSDAATQARITQFKTGEVRKRSDGSFVAEDIVQVIGEHPEFFPTDYGRLVLLIPGSLGPGGNRDLLLKDIVGVNTQTTWRSRLSLIYDVVDRLDFSFYASPKGDVICEMPLYDFEPDDFGDQAVDLETILGLGRSSIKFSTDGAQHLGPYAPGLRIARRDTNSWERTFSDENVRTQMVGISNLIPGFEQLGTSNEVGQVHPVNLYGLIPQFGVRSELIEPRGIISSENAARVYAGVKLNQINSNARTAKVQIMPRVQLGFPNRPLEFEERSYVATSERISHTLVWGVSGDMNTDVDVQYVRAWGGQTVDNRPVYEPIGGFASQSLNYALRLGFRDPSLRNTRDNGES